MGSFLDTLLTRLGLGELAQTMRDLLGDEPFRDKPRLEKVLTVVAAAAVLAFAASALLVPLLFPAPLGRLLYLMGLAAAGGAALARLFGLPAEVAAKAATVLSFFLLLGWGFGARPRDALVATAAVAAVSPVFAWIHARFGRRGRLEPRKGGPGTFRWWR